MGAALALASWIRLVLPLLSRSRSVPGLGVTPYDMMLQAVGAATDPASGGRQMPTHWSSRPCILSALRLRRRRNCCMLWAARRRGAFSRHPEAAAKAEGDYRAFHDVEFHGDEVVAGLRGRGLDSQGEFWEAINTASNQKLPVIFLRGRQRLRDQRSCRGEHAGRQHLAAGGQLSQLLFCRDRWQRSRGLPARFSGGGGALPRGPWAGAGSRTLRAALFPFAF